MFIYVQVHICAWVCRWRPKSEVLSSVNLGDKVLYRTVLRGQLQPSSEVQLSLLTNHHLSWAC